jgi:hypothetical protein
MTLDFFYFKKGQLPKNLKVLQYTVDLFQGYVTYLRIVSRMGQKSSLSAHKENSEWSLSKYSRPFLVPVHGTKCRRTSELGHFGNSLLLSASRRARNAHTRALCSISNVHAHELAPDSIRVHPLQLSNSLY